MSTAADRQVVANLVIEELAASEAALIERVDALRELNSVALDLLREREQEIARQRRVIDSLRDELRRYVRAQIGVAA